MKIIKLENIRPNGEFVNEYVCENCRHLVNENDATCWKCGESLETSEVIEHYHKGKRLTDKDFQALKLLETNAERNK